MAHAASQLKKKADLDLTAAEDEKNKKKKLSKRSKEPKKKVPVGHGSEGGAFGAGMKVGWDVWKHLKGLGCLFEGQYSLRIVFGNKNKAFK